MTRWKTPRLTAALSRRVGSMSILFVLTAILVSVGGVPLNSTGLRSWPPPIAMAMPTPTQSGSPWRLTNVWLNWQWISHQVIKRPVGVVQWPLAHLIHYPIDNILIRWSEPQPPTLVIVTFFRSVNAGGIPQGRPFFMCDPTAEESNEHCVIHNDWVHIPVNASLRRNKAIYTVVRAMWLSRKVLSPSEMAHSDRGVWIFRL